MTREDAIIILDCERPYGNCGCGASIEEIEDALNMAIKALEQEPVLDKIKAEIEKLQKMCDKNDLNLMAQHSAFGMVLDIIDKYKAESEVEE